MKNCTTCAFRVKDEEKSTEEEEKTRCDMHDFPFECNILWVDPEDYSCDMYEESGT